MRICLPKSLRKLKWGEFKKDILIWMGNQEAVRQRAIAAVNVIQKAKTINNDSGQNPDEDLELTSNLLL